jgi:serine/threonine-protein kinase RsbW
VSGGCEVTREARLENLPALLQFVSDACRGAGASSEDEFALKLAVEEACVNIIVHGYAGREPGPVSVAIRWDPDRFVVTIEDLAAPFQPDSVPEPDLTAGWEEREIGGLGWWLLRKMVDEFEYESVPGRGNRLTLVKRRDAGQGPPQGGPNAG